MRNIIICICFMFIMLAPNVATAKEQYILKKIVLSISDLAGLSDNSSEKEIFEKTYEVLK